MTLKPPDVLDSTILLERMGIYRTAILVALTATVTSCAREPAPFAIVARPPGVQNAPRLVLDELVGSETVLRWNLADDRDRARWLAADPRHDLAWDPRGLVVTPGAVRWHRRVDAGAIQADDALADQLEALGYID